MGTLPFPAGSGGRVHRVTLLMKGREGLASLQGGRLSPEQPISSRRHQDAAQKKKN